MSVLIPAIGALEEPTSLLLTTTSVTDVLAMAAGRQDIVTVANIIIASSHNSTCLVSVWWTLNSTDYLIFNRVLAATETVTEAITAPIRLNAKSTARKIRAQAATGSVVTVTLITMQPNEQVSRG